MEGQREKLSRKATSFQTRKYTHRQPYYTAIDELIKTLHHKHQSLEGEKYREYPPTVWP